MRNVCASEPQSDKGHFADISLVQDVVVIFVFAKNLEFVLFAQPISFGFLVVSVNVLIVVDDNFAGVVALATDCGCKDRALLE